MTESGTADTEATAESHGYKMVISTIHKHGKSPELISHDCGQRSFYHALLLKGGCTVEHIGALAFL